MLIEIGILFAGNANNDIAIEGPIEAGAGLIGSARCSCVVVRIVIKTMWIFASHNC